MSRIEFDIAKYDIIRELFVRTADENYISARWCAANAMHVDFAWQSTHALEKYMKAALLMNGKSTKNGGHDICGLYENLKKFASNLLPKVLTKPRNLNLVYWQEQSPENFLKYLYDNGNHHNRYLIYGYSVDFQDVHMVDQMVFAVRRLICPFDKPFAGDYPQLPKMTYREALAKSARFAPKMNMPLEEVIRDQRYPEKRHAALNLNMEFAPKGYEHEPQAAHSAFAEPVLVRRIFDGLKSDDKNWAEEGIALAEWLLANVYIPGKDKHGVVKEIKDAVALSRMKHGIAVNAHG